MSDSRGEMLLITREEARIVPERSLIALQASARSDEPHYAHGEEFAELSKEFVCSLKQKRLKVNSGLLLLPTFPPMLQSVGSGRNRGKLLWRS